MFRSSPSPALRCRVETRRRSSAKHRGHSEKRSEVLEQTYQSRRRRRSRSVTQGSAGSDNTSTIISDEGTHVDTLEKNGTNFFSLTEDSGDLDESVTDDTLWILENNSIQDREPVVCVLDDQNLDVVEVGSVKDKDDSFDSLSWTSTASGPTLLEDKRPLVPCQNCAKLFTKMKKVKRWKKIIDYATPRLSCPSSDAQEQKKSHVITSEGLSGRAPTTCPTCPTCPDERSAVRDGRDAPLVGLLSGGAFMPDPPRGSDHLDERSFIHLTS
ncbi:hypothetical protein Z043_116093 [Scleropages formosus]|uniref:Uncharacterized protein n=1 Tax=Scleropages formosus TaxID=113540 RepID=A0A0P7UU92_SCLFO|nr:hypothetical protein Z043_116093 [Scleropages formosus]